MIFYHSNCSASETEESQITLSYKIPLQGREMTESLQLNFSVFNVFIKKKLVISSETKWSREISLCFDLKISPQGRDDRELASS
jgi:hypothetical protein